LLLPPRTVPSSQPPYPRPSIPSFTEPCGPSPVRVRLYPKALGAAADLLADYGALRTEAEGLRAELAALHAHHRALPGVPLGCPLCHMPSLVRIWYPKHFRFLFRGPPATTKGSILGWGGLGGFSCPLRGPRPPPLGQPAARADRLPSLPQCPVPFPSLPGPAWPLSFVDVFVCPSHDAGRTKDPQGPWDRHAGHTNAKGTTRQDPLG